MKLRHLLSSGAALLAILGGSLAVAQQANAADFYTIPAALPQQNGDVIKQEPSSFYLEPFKLTPVAGEVRRVMYKSTNSQGNAIAVTGTVMKPRTPWIGVNISRPWAFTPRPLVVMTPGTRGNADACAPSKNLATGEDYEGAIIAALLAAGYAVAIPDYEGVGTAPKATYMDRVATGNASLDMARAAQRSNLSGVPSSGPVMFAGYSQGGQASAAAAELSSSYAPELDIRGAYAGGVPANLFEVAKSLDGGPRTAFLLSAVSGLATANNMDMSQYLNAEGLDAIARNDQMCTTEQSKEFANQDTSKYTLSGQKMSAILQNDPLLRSIADKQRLGLKAPTKFPVLVGQSEFDDVIPAPQAHEFARQWCQGGANLRYSPSVAPSHVTAGARFVPEMVAFLGARASGLPAVSNCRWI